MTRYDKLSPGQRLARDGRRNINARAVWQGHKSRLPFWIEILYAIGRGIAAHVRELRKVKRTHVW